MKYQVFENQKGQGYFYKYYAFGEGEDVVLNNEDDTHITEIDIDDESLYRHPEHGEMGFDMYDQVTFPNLPLHIHFVPIS